MCEQLYRFEASQNDHTAVAGARKRQVRSRSTSDQPLSLHHNSQNHNAITILKSANPFRILIEVIGKCNC